MRQFLQVIAQIVKATEDILWRISCSEGETSAKKQKLAVCFERKGKENETAFSDCADKK